MKRGLISRISISFLKKRSSVFKINRLFVKEDQNVYKTANKSAYMHTDEILNSF